MSSSGFPARPKTITRKRANSSERVQFDNAFIFRYSTRRDTPAADDAEPSSGTDQRGAQPGFAQNRERIGEAAPNDRLVGREVEILCEGPSRTNRRSFDGPNPNKQESSCSKAKTQIASGKLFDVRCATGEWFQLVWHAGHAKLTPHFRGMIYHLSLQAAGIIAGVFLLLVAVPGLLKPELDARISPAFSALPPPALLCSRSI